MRIYARERRAKIRDDPELHEQYCQQERERNLQRKNKGVELKFKNVSQLTEREKRSRKSKQVIWTRHHRLRARIDDSSASNAGSSSNVHKVSNQVRAVKKYYQKKRVECYATNSSLRKENKILKNTVLKISKRFCRLKAKFQKKNDSLHVDLKNRLTGTNLPKNLQKDIIVNSVICQQLSERYKSLRNNNEKCIIRKALSGGLISKYKMLSNVSKKLGLFIQKRRMRINESSKKKIREKIKTFFLSNSKIDPGKKAYIKLRGFKYQKRYLESNLIDLFDKFSSENKNIKTSYATFARCRPAQCVALKMSERNTCACSTHENFNILVKTLHSKNLIAEKSDYQVSRSITCSENRTELCYSRACNNCKTKQIVFNSAKINSDDTIVFNKWISCEESRISAKTKQPIKVRVTKKQVFEKSIAEVHVYFQNELENYMKHVHQFLHQKNTISTLIDSLGDDECVINVDFSENYTGKCATEVQSAHFGASKTQMTIHTGVLYMKNCVKGFATISPNLDHDAVSVFGHVHEILAHFKKQGLLAPIKKIHFVSDGPSTQYKNKNIFFLMTLRLSKFFPQFKFITYNYFAAGHGKSAADGIGGSLKRMADSAVLYGIDICNVDDLVSFLSKNSNVTVLKVSDAQIKKNKSPGKIAIPFKGTRHVHQFIWEKMKPKVVKFNKLSCYSCKFEKECNHFSVGFLTYPTLQSEKITQASVPHLKIVSTKQVKTNIVIVKREAIKAPTLRRSQRSKVIR